ncbi:MAG: helix-turn-helix domain-containing protein [Geminicoccales bacterium]
MRNCIRELRKARGPTLQTLADRVQASNQHISHLESGRRRLTIDWIERLARGLECDPLALLGANAEEISEQELLLLKVFRALDEDQRNAFIAAAAALANPSSRS